ncbi:YesL family protein [Mobilitalea sibirica]|uniref:YesL family protein n=1 Tax=Mobilitalea sibirica TaxID=1462919 RepID=A0A8J7HBQ5_9FIRM|nr:DUF624 domain-containing protein [Mobilitalea sibirica]MBH1939499.1 YesL family protein [Mobilitalea sibirica]
MKFLNYDTNFMKHLGRLSDILILGIWSAVCSIPIVTMGASISATYYVTLKMVRDEENSVTKGFFRGFKANFKKATLIWIVMVALAVFFYFNFLLMNAMEMKYENIIRILNIIIVVNIYFVSVYIFPLLVFFENTLKNTIKNSVILAFTNIPKSIMVFMINIGPFVALYYFPYFFPFIVLFSISVTCFINSILIRGVFDKHIKPEDKEDNTEDDTEDDVDNDMEDSYDNHRTGDHEQN